MNTVVRELPGADAGAMLRGVLGAVDFGVLFTDLEHTALSCNKRFGEIFGVEPEKVVHSDPEEVRAMVRRRIADLDEWTANLKDVYSDASLIQHDRLRLLHPKAMLERYTGPVCDEDGQVTGRLWTFKDITLEDARRRARDTLHEASLVFDPDPAAAYRRLTELVGKHYGAISLLSIRRDGFMEFRAVGGPPSPARTMRGNDLRDSFCQLCLAANGPVLVQDGRKDARTARLLPVQLGLTRYMGVPVRDMYGETIGTLCLLDGKSDEILNEEDMSFLGQIAVRISGELDREARETALRHDLERVQSRLIREERLGVAGLLGTAAGGAILDALADESVSPGPRLEAMAERLLSYERPREARFARLEVAEVVRRTLARLESQFQAREIKVELLEEPPLPSVHADPLRFDRMILNLMLDALEAIPPGGQYRLRLWRESGEVRLEASDDRPESPLDPFEPFQPDSAADLGLGLYAAREIARECGGRLERKINSKGANYRVDVPIA